MADKTYTRTIPKKQPTTITTPEGTPDRIKAARERCKARGGVWDEATRTCEVERKPVGAGGSITTEAERQAVGQVGDTERELARVRSTGLPSAAEKIIQKEEEFKQTQAIETEKARLIAEETPERRELDPAVGFGETFPIFGGSVALGRTLIGEPIKDALGIELSQDLKLTPETMRTVALTQIEKEEIERGLTANEKFGAFIEGIPLIGSLANQFAGGLIETPSENTVEVVSNIRKEKRRIANIETNVKMGYLPVSVANEQLGDIENNIQRLESRAKLLISNSPELRFNSDGVNTIETEILLTREKILQGKLNVLTGASTDPAEIQILQQLLLQQEAEDD